MTAVFGSVLFKWNDLQTELIRLAICESNDDRWKWMARKMIITVGDDPITMIDVNPSWFSQKAYHSYAITDWLKSADDSASKC